MKEVSIIGVDLAAHLKAEIGRLDAEIARRAKENEAARRLMTVPGICPQIATAIAVLTPSPAPWPATWQASPR